MDMNVGKAGFIPPHLSPESNTTPAQQSMGSLRKAEMRGDMTQVKIRQQEAQQTKGSGGKEVDNAAELIAKAKNKSAAYAGVVFSQLDSAKATPQHLRALEVAVLNNIKIAFNEMK